MAKVVHYRNAFHSGSACNAIAPGKAKPGQITDKRADVTCKRCRRSMEGPEAREDS